MICKSLKAPPKDYKVLPATAYSRSVSPTFAAWWPGWKGSEGNWAVQAGVHAHIHQPIARASGVAHVHAGLSLAWPSSK